MKKVILLILSAILAFTFVGCSQDQQTLTTEWSYEKLTYSVMEYGSSEKGTLTLTAEMLIQNREYSIPQIGKDRTVTTINVELSPNSHILTGRLEFGGDVMEYVTVTTSGFRPLYSYKSLIIGAEQKVYAGEGDAPDCLSYIMTTAYDRSAPTAESVYLRRTVYGEQGWDGNFSSDDYWMYHNQSFTDMRAPFYDVNQLYYVIRSLNDVTDSDFTYSCYTPMVLERDTKYLYCVGESVSQSVNSIPYIADIVKNYKPDYSLDVSKITITPQDSNVRGKGIEVYYAQSPIYSREQLEAGVYSVSGSSMKGLVKVPVLIKENIDSTGQGNQNGRGTMTYSLVDISNERPN